METPPNWTTNANSGTISVRQLQGWAPMLREGLETPGTWGYGIRRLTVKEKNGQCPMTFSAMGFRDKLGKWSIGLRMNVDQVSPIKFRDWNDGDNIIDILTGLMSEHLREKGYTGNYGTLI